jgi:hypothetical protein
MVQKLETPLSVANHAGLAWKASHRDRPRISAKAIFGREVPWACRLLCYEMSSQVRDVGIREAHAADTPN